MAREYVPIFFDWLQNTQDLTAEEKGHLIDAVIMYASGMEDWMDQLQTSGEKVAFRFMCGQIDRGFAISEARAKAGASKREHDKTNENKTQQTETKPNEEEKEEEEEKEKEKDNKESLSRARERPDMDAFGAFWDEYPNKKAKQDAIRAWRKLKPDAALINRIMAGLAKAKNSDSWLRDEGRFIPYPATWLNGRRWEDEVTTGHAPPRVPAQQYSQRDYSVPMETVEEMMTRLNGGVMPGA